MVAGYICDRCGKTELFKANSIVPNMFMLTQRKMDRSIYKTVDLCSECMEELISWIDKTED